MERLYFDIILRLCRYLNDKEVFNLLTTNKSLYKYIELYYKRKKINYEDVIKYNIHRTAPQLQILNNIYTLSITCSYLYEHDLNMFQKLYYKFKKYYRFVKRKKYVSYYIYSIIVKPIELKINNFLNLEQIIFDDYFDQELDFQFPSNIKRIYFGKRFNKSIDQLPDSIEIIEFEYRSLFCMKINKYPVNLKKIIYGRNFSDSINNLPDSVEIINMKYCIYKGMSIYKLPNQLKIIILRGDNKICCDINDNVKIYSYEFSFFNSVNPNIKSINWVYGSESKFGF